MADLAKRIAQENDSITLGEIKWEKFKASGVAPRGSAS